MVLFSCPTFFQEKRTRLFLRPSGVPEKQKRQRGAMFFLPAFSSKEKAEVASKNLSSLFLAKALNINTSNNENDKIFIVWVNAPELALSNNAEKTAIFQEICRFLHMFKGFKRCKNLDFWHWISPTNINCHDGFCLFFCMFPLWQLIPLPYVPAVWQHMSVLQNRLFPLLGGMCRYRCGQSCSCGAMYRTDI